MEISDIVKVINPNHQLYGCTGKIINTDSLYDINGKEYPKVKVNFTGFKNCIRNGYQKEWSLKHNKIGFWRSFNPEDLEVVAGV